MLRITQFKVPVFEDTAEYIYAKIAKQLRTERSCIASYIPIRRSIDARKKNDPLYVYTLDVAIKGDEDALMRRLNDKNIAIAPKQEPYSIPKAKTAMRPIVCGMGPAGLFAAYALAQAGANPLVIERGKDVDSRLKDIENFIQSRTLDTESNIQFGEGGAGTFSDGKLTTGTSGKELRYILETFVRFGAPENILYDAKPHIGTDVLREVIKNIRNEILSLGGEVRFETKLTDLHTANGQLQSITVTNGGTEVLLPCNHLILAIGHSARDTFELLYNKNMRLEQKPFSIGVRIEHDQHKINQAQYGTDALGGADYKLNVKTSDGRGVYTFCMCPGGHVIAAASESGGVVTNGMSYHARDGKNANAALLCDVRTSDFESDHPLAGMYLQRKFEQLAFQLGGENYAAPATLVGDFLNKRASTTAGHIAPTYRPDVHWCDISACLPDFVTNALREALPLLDNKLKGFADKDAVLTAIESRSSSPIRICRDHTYMSDISGIYPCGEGAGYAGGIMSAAADGLKVAMQIIYENNEQTENI